MDRRLVDRICRVFDVAVGLVAAAVAVPGARRRCRRVDLVRQQQERARQHQRSVIAINARRAARNWS